MAEGVRNSDSPISTSELPKFSKRELFNKVLGRQHASELTTIDRDRPGEQKPSEYEPSIVLPRRDFIKFMGGLALTLGLAQAGIPEAQAASPSNTSQAQEDSAPMTPIKETYEETQIGQTIAESTLVTIGKILILASNQSLRRKEPRIYINGPVDAIEATTILPLLEEAVFRALPSYLIDQAGGKMGELYWQIGVPTSSAFAAIHGLKPIPLTHFLGGVYNWYVMRKRGYGHAVTAHATNNAIFLALMSISKHAHSPESSKTNSSIPITDRLNEALQELLRYQEEILKSEPTERSDALKVAANYMEKMYKYTKLTKAWGDELLNNGGVSQLNIDRVAAILQEEETVLSSLRQGDVTGLKDYLRRTANNDLISELDERRRKFEEKILKIIEEIPDRDEPFELPTIAQQS